MEYVYMTKISMVQNYLVDGVTVKAILHERYNGYKVMWHVQGDDVKFWNDVIPLSGSLNLMSLTTFHWKVIDDRIYAINYAAMELTKKLAILDFVITHDFKTD